MQNREHLKYEAALMAPLPQVPQSVGGLKKVTVELYEEPTEVRSLPVIVRLPKGIPQSALHD
jgi:hypothetical protein